MVESVESVVSQPSSAYTKPYSAVYEDVINADSTVNDNTLQACWVWGVPACTPNREGSCYSWSSVVSSLSPMRARSGQGSLCSTAMYTYLHLGFFVVDVFICFGMMGVVSLLHDDERQVHTVVRFSREEQHMTLTPVGHVQVIVVVFASTFLTMLGNTVTVWRMRTHREYDTREVQVLYNYMVITIIRTIILAVVSALSEVNYLLLLAILQFCVGYACIMIDKHKEISMLGTRCQFDDYVHVRLFFMYLVGEVGTWVQFIVVYSQLDIAHTNTLIPLLASQGVATLLHCAHMIAVQQATVVDWELSNVVATAINTYTTASLAVTTVVYVLGRSVDT